jgi:hypothetical protein
LRLLSSACRLIDAATKIVRADDAQIPPPTDDARPVAT